MLRNPLLGILLLTMIWCASCKDDPHAKLNGKISLMLRSQNNIDEQEWQDLSEFVRTDKLLSKELLNSKGELDVTKLRERILQVAQRRRGMDTPDIFVPKNNDNRATGTVKINLFIENSGSMDGYVRGNRNFEVATGRLLVLSKDFCPDKKRFNIFFINKEAYPAPEIYEFTDFAKALEPGSAPYNMGDRAESILNNVLAIVLDSTNSNTVSILVSDCIYSLSPPYDTKSSLPYQQTGTMEVFLRKLRAATQYNLATFVCKMVSDFEGKYYPYNYISKNKNYTELSASNATRPYYIWVIGKQETVEEYLQKINFASLEGYRNSLYFSSDTKPFQPYYTVLKESNRIGSFRPENRETSEVKSIEDIEYQKGKLQFSIAADLSKIPVDASYLTDKGKYQAPGFDIVSVDKINRETLAPRDRITIEKTTATHVITVATNANSSLQDLRLSLRKETPSWVAKGSNTDDVNIMDQLDQTFGFSYLVQGVADAYSAIHPDSKSFLTISVHLKK